MSKPLDRVKIRAIAAQIAADLFTNGCAELAQRLVLTIDKPIQRDLGGWSQRGATGSHRETANRSV